MTSPGASPAARDEGRLAVRLEILCATQPDRFHAHQQGKREREKREKENKGEPTRGERREARGASADGQEGEAIKRYELSPNSTRILIISTTLEP